MLGVGYCFAVFNGVPSRLPKEALAILDAAMDRQARRQLNLEAADALTVGDVVAGALPKFGSNDPSAPIQFLVWGDSHAKVALTAFNALSLDLGVAGRAAITYSTPPLVGGDFKLKGGSGDSEAMGRAILDYVQRNKILHTVLVAYWGLYERSCGEQHLASSINNTILKLQEQGTKVWVVMDVPAHEVDVPKYLIRRHLFGSSTWDVSDCTPDAHRSRNAAIYHLSSLPSAATFLDPTSFLLDRKTQRYKITEKGIPLYYDNNHLTERGALFALLPVLEAAFAAKSPAIILNPP
jgi:hypothetical protein